ncbi:MAG: hypothetical protein COT91_05425 [Candidatus Doudnabacteria bacterium CG10_big_fil_rev_8_21_14_0_10_41_10]|uniref:Glycogen synthase n=1 Tax=Candidatus Doudnabacteria bacterium CG10_big_fil_rev_8_21_14_0_10_41_10 TaxID=1974551 RepID=A0A2H0VC59_9BACT|nr:MAG: hypothetical protein COT91_05425 [Candidatus Doudnabacteria bacterium CG10_big_fil_rev_8_21_14_0_10_41_10]
MRFSFSKKLKIIHAVAEVSPYSKVGGLGDVGYALPKAIARLGHESIIVTPYYGLVRKKGIKKEKLGYAESIKVGDKEFPISFYKHISIDGLPIYFVVNEELYGAHQAVYRAIDDESLRWIVFNLAVIELIKYIKFEADIIHAHEWHAGLIANYIKTIYKHEPIFQKSVTLFTIHNLYHQGTFFWQHVKKETYDKGTGAPPVDKKFRRYINYTKRAVLYSDIINTVSERYAKEITTPKFGAGLDQYLKRRKNRLFGIINGIDYEIVNPAYDKNVYVNYDVNSLEKKLKNKKHLQKEVGLSVQEKTPLLGVVNRLTEQKGFKLIIEALPTLLKMDLQIVIVGSGQKSFLKFFREVARKNSSKIGVYSPFTEKMASRVYAGSDIYLMPSRFEPCGLSQLISLRYGSIPIVHHVGGLQDTVTNYDPLENTGNGFVFTRYNKDELLVAIARATESYKYKEKWNKTVYRAMKQSFSWELPAKKYIELYLRALKIKNHQKNGS